MGKGRSAINCPMEKGKWGTVHYKTSYRTGHIQNRCQPFTDDSSGNPPTCKQWEQIEFRGEHVNDILPLVSFLCVISSLPLHSLVQPCAFGGWSLKDLPFSVFKGRQAQGVGHLGRCHGLIHVLFVRKHHKDRLLQLLFLNKTWSQNSSMKSGPFCSNFQ